jgi:hypothetical protein
VSCLLVLAGFSILLAKSDGPKDAARSKEYLGFIIDTSNFGVHVPSHKMLRVVALLDQFLLSSWRSCREVASIVGRLNSLEPALGTEIFVGTRLASIKFVAVAEAHSWSWHFSLSSDAMCALREVRGLIHLWNGHPICAPHTCIALASVLPREAEVSLERKIPAGCFQQTQVSLASDELDLAVTSFCVDGLPAFDFFSSLKEEEKSWSFCLLPTAKLSAKGLESTF